MSFTKGQEVTIHAPGVVYDGKRAEIVKIHQNGADVKLLEHAKQFTKGQELFLNFIELWEVPELEGK